MRTLFVVILTLFISTGCAFYQSPYFAWEGRPYGATREYLGDFYDYPEEERDVKGLPPDMEFLIYPLIPVAVVATAVDVPISFGLDTVLLPLAIVRYCVKN